TNTAGGGTSGGTNTGGGGTSGGTNTAGGGTSGGTNTAGGGTSGGTNTAGGGGNPCGGAPAGTYVCPTCPGASNLNNGSAGCPVLTVNRGITNAQALSAPVVFVATRFGSAGAQIVYTEDVIVPAGIRLEGAYVPSSMAGGLSWAVRSAAPADRSVIQNTTALGLRFGGAAMRGNTGVDRIAVRVVSQGAERAGISVVDSSPTLNEVTVTGTALPPFGANETGVFVNTVATRANPLISQVSISGIRASSAAAGLYINNSRADVSSLTVAEVVSLATASGGGAGAYGIALNNATSTQISNSTASVLGGPACVGVIAGGNVSDIVLDGVGATGCNPQGIVMNLPTLNAGGLIDGCPALTGQPMIWRNSGRIFGGPVQAPGLAVGVEVSNGCAVDLLNNVNIVGAQGLSAGLGSLGIGVLCTYQGGVAGTDPRCRIVGNGSIIGSTSPQITSAAGIWCEGACASSTVACAGACVEIRDNKANPNGAGGINAGAAQNTAVGLYVEQSNPMVQRNSIGPGETSGCQQGRGVVLEGSRATLQNNAIIGPTCSTGTSVGVEIVAASRSGDGSFPSPVLHSNSILSHAWFGAAPAVPQNQSGVRLSLGMGPIIVPGPQLGAFTNNVFQAGPGGTRTFAFEESSSALDPVSLANNDFFVSGAPDGGPLYLDEGTTPLTTVAQINALTGATANVSLSPGFTSIQFSFPHISGTSLLRGLGPGLLGSSGPTDDWDGQQRPNPTGSNMDIGADEVGP
ncbi:MAG: hypothetical protein JNK82_43265, partial [Myxococcaceae bacterium]|nr:hypothetical protein [Myxococcaceae bacterium]